MTDQRRELGRWGEDVAARFLRRQGLKILHRNVRTPVGEIDIVARNRRTLVFVEVKTRRGLSHGYPQEAVGASKQRQILRAAQWYLSAQRMEGLQPRFDVVAVRGDGKRAEIDHFPGAFDVDGW
jgi:putative endonuclease